MSKSLQEGRSYRTKCGAKVKIVHWYYANQSVTRRSRVDGKYEYIYFMPTFGAPEIKFVGLVMVGLPFFYIIRHYNPDGVCEEDLPASIEFEWNGREHEDFYIEIERIREEK